MCADGATAHLHSTRYKKRRSGGDISHAASAPGVEGEGGGENMLAAYLELMWYALKIEGNIGSGCEILALEFKCSNPS